MASKKELRHGTKSCDATYDINYDENNVPYLVCSGCGYTINDWIKWKQEYSKFWEMPEKWSSKKDHLMCLMGYFSKLYNQHYGTDFTFSLNDKGLFRGPEVTLLRKMYSLLGNDADLSKTYLEWIFAKKVVLKKKKITSLGFLATPAIVQEFKLSYKKSLTVDRNTVLPSRMIDWIKKFTPTVLSNVSLRDFGELKLLLTYFKDGHFSDDSEMKTLINKLIETGYISEQLEIKNWR